MMILLAFLAQATSTDTTATNTLIATIVAVLSGIAINIILRFKGDQAINGKVDGVTEKVDGVTETVDNLNAQITELNKDIVGLKTERDNANKATGIAEKRGDELQRQITRLEEQATLHTQQLHDLHEKRSMEIEAALKVAQKLADANELRIDVERRVHTLETTLGVVKGELAVQRSIKEIVDGMSLQFGGQIEKIAAAPSNAPPHAAPPVPDSSAQPIMPGDNVVIARPGSEGAG